MKMLLPAAAALLAATIGASILTAGAARAATVDHARDRSDTHAWVTTRGEFKQLGSGMSRAEVDDILDSRLRSYEGRPCLDPALRDSSMPTGSTS
jgi:hypothetical protein